MISLKKKGMIHTRNPRDLCSATHCLKAEALRRYKLANGEEPDDDVGQSAPDEGKNIQGEQEESTKQQQSSNMGLAASAH